MNSWMKFTLAVWLVLCSVAEAAEDTPLVLQIEAGSSRDPGSSLEIYPYTPLPQNYFDLFQVTAYDGSFVKLLWLRDIESPAPGASIPFSLAIYAGPRQSDPVTGRFSNQLYFSGGLNHRAGELSIIYAPVPEPSAYVATGLGLLMLAGALGKHHRHKRSAKPLFD